MDFAGKLEGALNTLAGVVGNVSGKFESLAEPFGRFVEALSPGEMELFGSAMRDLNATIGHAFLPVIQQLTKGASEAAAALVPAVTALAPIMNSLGATVKDLVVISVERMASALTKATPLLDALASSARVAVGVYDALIQTLSGGSGINTLFKTLGEWITKLVTTIVSGIAALAASLGATGFRKNLIDSLKGKNRAEGGLTGGVHDVGIKGLEQITKDLAVAAAYAAGGPSESPETEMLRKILEQLEKDEREQKTFMQWFTGGSASLGALIIDTYETLVNKLNLALQSMKRDIIAALPGWLRRAS